MKNWTLLACVLASSAQATLVDVPGANYSFDATTNLRWLDVGSTSNFTYEELAVHVPGWRLATGSELSDLFASNLAVLTRAPAEHAPGVPFYGGALTDFYAPRQGDEVGAVANLISLLGGPTMKLRGDARGVALIGLIDRDVLCIGGCSAHALSSLAAYRDGTADVSIAGGMMDTFASPMYGRFLVQTGIPSVPEPGTPWLALAGLLLTFAYVKRSGGQGAAGSTFLSLPLNGRTSQWRGFAKRFRPATHRRRNMPRNLTFRVTQLALLCLLLIGCSGVPPQASAACIPGDPGGSPSCQAATYQNAR